MCVYELDILSSVDVQTQKIISWFIILHAGAVERRNALPPLVVVCVSKGATIVIKKQKVSRAFLTFFFIL